MEWPGILEAVAGALSQAWLPAVRDEPGQSLLDALAEATPRSLRRAVARQAAAGGDGEAVEPLIHQNDLPPYLLANGAFEVAATAVADRVAAAVAVCALSTLGSGQAPHEGALSPLPRRLAEFAAPAWQEGLAALAARTAELNGLLRAAAGTRRQQWRGVPPDDRILAEAAAAAVVGGAAGATGVPPQTWRFPFHLFCRLGVSAAEDAGAAIERWLGIEFLPAPHTRERTASLAALVAAQAMTLAGGCRCKDGIDRGEVAFVPRGACRQEDHDLRLWRPGGTRPGSRGGGRFAATLWGWHRRWLGGAGAAPSPPAAARPRLRSHDVAGSVLARCWLAVDRGFGGPVLRYDRILPEACLNCGATVRIAHRTAPGGRAATGRDDCCERPRRVYRSEISLRGGGAQVRHKLGVVVAAQEDGAPGGYCSTAPLGPLWLCASSGRYSLAGRYCPDPGCGPHDGGGHLRVDHGWVLLPRGQAWADLRGTAARGDGAAAAGGGGGLSEDDLRYLREALGLPAQGAWGAGRTAAEVWERARGWSAREMEAFRKRAGKRGLELLLKCKQAAEGAQQAGPGRMTQRRGM